MQHHTGAVSELQDQEPQGHELWWISKGSAESNMIAELRSQAQDISESMSSQAESKSNYEEISKQVPLAESSALADTPSANQPVVASCLSPVLEEPLESLSLSPDEPLGDSAGDDPLSPFSWSDEALLTYFNDKVDKENLSSRGSNSCYAAKASDDSHSPNREALTPSSVTQFVNERSDSDVNTIKKSQDNFGREELLQYQRALEQTLQQWSQETSHSALLREDLESQLHEYRLHASQTLAELWCESSRYENCQEELEESRHEFDDLARSSNQLKEELAQTSFCRAQDERCTIEGRDKLSQRREQSPCEEQRQCRDPLMHVSFQLKAEESQSSIWQQELNQYKEQLMHVSVQLKSEESQSVTWQQELAQCGHELILMRTEYAASANCQQEVAEYQQALVQLLAQLRAENDMRARQEEELARCRQDFAKLAAQLRFERERAQQSTLKEKMAQSQQESAESCTNQQPACAEYEALVEELKEKLAECRSELASVSFERAQDEMLHSRQESMELSAQLQAAHGRGDVTMVELEQSRKESAEASAHASAEQAQTKTLEEKLAHCQQESAELSAGEQVASSQCEACQEELALCRLELMEISSCEGAEEVTRGTLEEKLAHSQWATAELSAGHDAIQEELVQCQLELAEVRAQHTSFKESKELSTQLQNVSTQCDGFHDELVQPQRESANASAHLNVDSAEQITLKGELVCCQEASAALCAQLRAETVQCSALQQEVAQCRQESAELSLHASIGRSRQETFATELTECKHQSAELSACLRTARAQCNALREELAQSERVSAEVSARMKVESAQGSLLQWELAQCRKNSALGSGIFQEELNQCQERLTQIADQLVVESCRSATCVEEVAECQSHLTQTSAELMVERAHCATCQEEITQHRQEAKCSKEELAQMSTQLAAEISQCTSYQEEVTQCRRAQPSVQPGARIIPGRTYQQDLANVVAQLRAESAQCMAYKAEVGQCSVLEKQLALCQNEAEEFTAQSSQCLAEIGQCGALRKELAHCQTQAEEFSARARTESAMRETLEEKLAQSRKQSGKFTAELKCQRFQGNACKERESQLLVDLARSENEHATCQEELVQCQQELIDSSVHATCHEELVQYQKESVDMSAYLLAESAQNGSCRQQLAHCEQELAQVRTQLRSQDAHGQNAEPFDSPPNPGDLSAQVRASSSKQNVTESVKSLQHHTSNDVTADAKENQNLNTVSGYISCSVDEIRCMASPGGVCCMLESTGNAGLGEEHQGATSELHKALQTIHHDAEVMEEGENEAFLEDDEASQAQQRLLDAEFEVAALRSAQSSSCSSGGNTSVQSTSHTMTPAGEVAGAAGASLVASSTEAGSDPTPDYQLELIAVCRHLVLAGDLDLARDIKARHPSLFGQSEQSHDELPVSNADLLVEESVLEESEPPPTEESFVSCSDRESNCAN
eukprot:gnl/MRDRNA2_/MRDRNA2_34520_c0_seq2.p1 gnl/MRDRNA2_/MRDRNA2_34520_c0~~gnl/MRDRNA2_/MRDRNA2_34520_c0_seq2.p1  ORF type:complete len:1608 (+),score=359.03 gnl/MRDRNA2_/MRDRNA2_34520_c0_seq2:530-4825(+)